jgi:two-component system sensor histidine kinase/response regulator
MSTEPNIKQENNMGIKQKGTVLIVDDEPVACDMMEGFLSPEGYDISFANSGPESLVLVEKLAPDIILLDVMMPEMNGFEVCQRLKSDKQWRHIPILLVTAYGGKEELIRGLDAGADDFLHKPIDDLELRARVRSLMRIKKQFDELEATLRLREDLTHMIVHDIRTPLTAIMGYSEMLLTRKTLTVTDAKDARGILTQAYRLDAFLNDMLILAKLEAEKLILNRSMVDINQLVEQVKNSYDIVALSKKVNLIINLPEKSQQVFLDTNLFQRVLENLISNALKFSPSGGTATVQIEYPRAKTSSQLPLPHLRVRISDEGPGITEEDRERIFDKFEIVKFEQTSPQIGLGLAFCKMVVEAHGGRIFVEANNPVGSIFTIEI